MIDLMAWRRMLALSTHYVYSLRRNPARLIEIFLWPAFELMIFVFLGQGIDAGETRAGLGSIIAAGAIYWILTARIIQEVVAQATEDFFTKNIQNILVSPVRVGEILVGLLIATFVKLCLSVVVLLALLFLLGDTSLLSVFLTNLPSLLLLLSFAGALGFFSLAFIFLFGERMSFIGWIVSTIIQVLSCVYYAREVLPFPLREFSWLTPSSYVFEFIRFDISVGLMPWLLTVAYYAFSLVVVYFSFQYARKNGSFTKS